MVDPVNTNTGETTRTTSERVDNSPSSVRSPTIGIIRNHLDPSSMGSVEVQLTTTSGSGDNNFDGELIACSYLSPFYGTTSYEGITNNPGAAASQRSYGWWGVPPDIGTKVLVIFAEGGKAFWMGCQLEENMNFMIPAGNPATSFNDAEDDSVQSVVEYNKATEQAAGRNATQFIKPVNADDMAVLTEQGLNQDRTRGITTSSARREAPSMVMGFSSPGPQDKREGAPKVTYGPEGNQTQVAQNRLGGSSIVFDDGDATLIRKGPPGGPNGVAPEFVNVEAGEDIADGDITRPHNEMLRLRTRTGHTILMHNTEDLIYIINSRGTAWIELTSNGKVDVYAADDISFHTEGNMNFKADGKMHFEAGADIHMKSGANIFQSAAANWEINVGADGKLTTGGVADFSNGGDFRVGAANTHFTGGSHTITGQVDMNGAPATAPGSAAEAEVSPRVPEHEPWYGHENLHIEEYQTATQEQVPTVNDTFTQNTVREQGTAAPNTTAEGTTDPDGTPTVSTGDNSLSTDLATALGGIGAGLSGALGALTGGLEGAVQEVTGVLSQPFDALSRLGTNTDTSIESTGESSVQTSTDPDAELRRDVREGRYPADARVTLANGERRRVQYNEETDTYSLVNFNV